MVHHYPKVEQLPQIAKKLLFCGMKKLFHENQINAFLDEHEKKDAFSFVEAIIDYFEVTIGLKKDEMSRIPAYGRTVVISNHPLGALDALALIHLLQDVRKDIKIVANSFLGQFENLHDILIPVDNVNGKLDKSSLNAIYQALEEEKAVIIFPSGEVSRARPNGVRDTRWKNGFLKIASKMKAPILPIHIKAKNSKSFYMLSMLNRSFATATLPHEMFKGRGKQIDFAVGRSIPFESYNLPLSTSEKVKLLRKHFYKIAKYKKEIFKTENPISMAETPSEIKKELKNGTLLGQTLDGKSIILYESVYESCVIKEIGRLREISFRFVGEGSGKKRDIDEFDFYYKHLIIWDDDELEIAGAYRLGVSGEIVEDFEISGLYTSSLFEYHEEFNDQLARGIELGRSFVQPKYWNSRALDYLWQGLGAFVKNRPDIRYLFGAVSMSDSFNEKAKALMIYFYAHYFASEEVLVTHKNGYKMHPEMQQYCEEIFAGDDYRADQRVLKQELGYMGYLIPTLYKQYAEVCEEGGVKFLDFGYDEAFNNCIDGFIVADLHQMKENKRKRYIGEV